MGRQDRALRSWAIMLSTILMTRDKCLQLSLVSLTDTGLLPIAESWSWVHLFIRLRGDGTLEVELGRCLGYYILSALR
jgi:hypothetical protein